MTSTTSDSFKHGMRRLAGAVCVIATGHAGERAGLTATAVCSVSAEPPRLLVCVNQSASAHHRIAAEGRLSVNVLTSQQQHIAERFATSSIKGEARFDNAAWRSVAHVPVLDDACVAFACEIVERIPAASHSIFLCEVVSCTVGGHEGSAADGLLYFDGRFRRLDDSASHG
ncbi:flavin reductase family protein [Pandoraea sputorum]|uniref:flavin reductase family protein n=1 Tax=Pandoraea sputorum TaxID=93222 RepID=UPI001E56B981|nr:flavin reductase family protein [Pandoraea sputorum]MCE4060722.1 flavin reductase family protein [Pandoraea sputorum]